MPQTPHIERHFTSSEVVRDIVIGMADGLTVPFALAAGLTGAIAQTGIIVTAGLAEIAAGSIAMGLGGYMAAKSDAEHYAKEREREIREVQEIPHEEMREVAEVFQAYGLSEDETWPRPRQCTHDCWRIHRGRSHSAFAVLLFPLNIHGTFVFSRLHARRVAGF